MAPEPRRSSYHWALQGPGNRTVSQSLWLNQGLHTIDQTGLGDVGASSRGWHPSGTSSKGKSNGWDEEFRVGGRLSRKKERERGRERKGRWWEEEGRGSEAVMRTGSRTARGAHHSFQIFYWRIENVFKKGTIQKLKAIRTKNTS